MLYKNVYGQGVSGNIEDRTSYNSFYRIWILSI